MNNEKQARTADEIEKAVQRRIEHEKDLKQTPESDNSEAQSLKTKKYNRELALIGLQQNETGDAKIYVHLLMGLYAWDSQEGAWRYYNGTFWEYDDCYRYKAAIEKYIVPVYLSYLAEINNEIIKKTTSQEDNNCASLVATQKKVIRRIELLRAEARKRNVLEAVKSNPENLTVPGNLFDKTSYLLACKNAVIDLRLNQTIPPRPEQYISLACNAEWQSFDAPAPQWGEFLLDIMAGSEEMVDYLRRLVGYVACGHPKEHICAILFGGGRNGKSVFVEVIRYILGNYAGPIPAEMLLASKVSRSSAGPSPDIMLLKGKRAVFASEPEEGRKFAVGPIKWMTGGDKLTGRWPHSPQFTAFSPSHILFMLTNFKPKAPAHDYAFWQRLHLITFPVTFVDREPKGPLEKRVKKGLAEKLKKEESAGILAWIVRGAKEYLAKGLNPPTEIAAATAEYRKSEDLLAEFYEDHCFIGAGAEVPAKDIYLRFSSWYEDTVGKKIPSARWFGEQLGLRFKRFKRGGCRMYSGIGLQTE